MANAAVLIEHGFLGDESFDDLRAGLVALGRSTFEAAVAGPDSLADHPLVREIAAADDLPGGQHRDHARQHHLRLHVAGGRRRALDLPLRRRFEPHP